MRKIRVMTVDGIEERTILTGGDATAYWHFDKVLAQYGPGYIVQLIDEQDNVLAEEETK